MATNVHLTPELERFARECVDAGRYNNMSEVVRSALRLLQDAEERRQHFQAMLRDAEDETRRDGSFTLQAVLDEADHIIDAPSRPCQP